MMLWTFLKEEEQSRTAGYLTSSLMVVTDLILLQKDFLKLKVLTLMNYSLQLSTMKLRYYARIKNSFKMVVQEDIWQDTD